ncbi:MAG: 4Fe-4S ferredoxin, partial [Desulfobacterales bacterium]|nr:4Fe-4S ferredoxin [Deltaproteobacteria bacterium]NIR12650.1 4Fe-4S ferredoxin [Desulfobacterales bacterium]
MAMNRREFLKIAGFSTLLGLGGKAAFELLAPGEIEAALEEVPLTAGKKWGMVVDMTKMDDKIMDRA